jgi:hypothetical protein
MANKRTKGRYVVVEQDGARIEDDWKRYLGLCFTRLGLGLWREAGRLAGWQAGGCGGLLKRRVEILTLG